MYSWLLVAALNAHAGETPDVAKAIDLPVAAEELKKGGVPDKDIEEAIEAGEEEKLDAGETAEVLKNADKAVKEHGPIDNFGAFVRAQLKEGKRGQELAAAIRAEHEARGKGKPDGAGKGGKAGAGKGGKAGGGKPDGGGKPGGAGKPGGGGKPDGAKGGKGGGH